MSIYLYNQLKLDILEKNKDLTNLVEGDEIIDSDGDRRIILAVVNPQTFSDTRVYVYSSYINHKVSERSTYTAYELREEGFTIPESEPSTSIKVEEVTLDEVAKAMDIPVEQLRIKKTEESV